MHVDENGQLSLFPSRESKLIEAVDDIMQKEGLKALSLVAYLCPDCNHIHMVSTNLPQSLAMFMADEMRLNNLARRSRERGCSDGEE